MKVIIRKIKIGMRKVKTGVRVVLTRLLTYFMTLIAPSTMGRDVYDQIIKNALKKTKKVEHEGIELFFSIPNLLNEFRAQTFSIKEPETLEWIDKIPEGSVLWDVGANVGLYSCYAAKKRRCRVFAFEPSVFNLEVLARNIYLNNLTDLVTILPLPLSELSGTNKLNMTTTEWGGALSTFGNTYGFDGKSLDKKFEFSTMGLSMNDAVTALNIPEPDYIKMDVDGIEHLILKGGSNILANVKGVLIEVNDNFKEQAENTSTYLRTAGLQFKEKRRRKVSDDSPYRYAYNQIWYR